MKKNSKSTNKTEAKGERSNARSKQAYVGSGDKQAAKHSPVVVILWGFLFFISPLFVFDFAEGFIDGFAWLVVLLYVALLLKLFVLQFGAIGVRGHRSDNTSPSNGGAGGDDGSGGCGDGGGGGGDGGGGG